MYECMQAEARVLILGRTSWHYDGGRRATAARPPQSRWCARVSDRVAGRAMPDFSKASPTPRMPAVPSRESSLEPRPVGTVPECVPPWRHTLSTRTVRPTGTCRAPATVAAWWFRVRSEDGTTTALHRRPGKEGPAPVPRGTGGLPPSPGLSSDAWTAAPSRLAGEPVQSQPHAPRACTPPSQGEKILSARRAGQAGRRAGSGKTIPSKTRERCHTPLARGSSQSTSYPRKVNIHPSQD